MARRRKKEDEEPESDQDPGEKSAANDGERLIDRTRLERAGPRTALVLKAVMRGEPRLEEPLAEVFELTRTAGIQALQSLTQNLERPHPATYLGKGKVEEAAKLAKELDVDFVVIDSDISPAQERNLEKLTGRTVIDRSQLIIDIFAQHARTHQAKLQVELAQLRYMRPRLKRMWTHLARYEGGIGMRGPGETQLETDKRLISKRIQRLVKELEEIEERKETSITHRESEFVVSLVGYTNAGKSTLLNALTGATELVEDKLFATLDTRVRRWNLAKNRHVLLTDTVGFIRKLPPHLVASFHATLADTRRANLLLHVVDASSTSAAAQFRTVNEVLRSLECHEKPTWVLLNKWDAVPAERAVEARSSIFQADAGGGRRRRGETTDTQIERFLTISALSGAGLPELQREISEYLQSQEEHLELELPHDRGDVVSYLQENARVEATEYEPQCVRIRCSITPARAARLRRIFPEGFREHGEPASTR